MARVISVPFSAQKVKISGRQMLKIFRKRYINFVYNMYLTVGGSHAG